MLPISPVPDHNCRCRRLYPRRAHRLPKEDPGSQERGHDSGAAPPPPPRSQLHTPLPCPHPPKPPPEVQSEVRLVAVSSKFCLFEMPAPYAWWATRQESGSKQKKPFHLSRTHPLSPCHPVTRSPRHPVALSPCHPVTISPSQPPTATFASLLSGQGEGCGDEPAPGLEEGDCRVA